MSIRQYERRLDPWRAVEVISTRDNSTDIDGSGYRIGGWLVLTAAHLVNYVGTACKVRWYAQNIDSGKEKDKVDTQAKVVWKNQELDIALIELPQEISKEEPITLGKLPKGERAEEITFQISGYPRFGVIQGVSNRLNFSGTINLGDSLLWLRIQEPLNSEWTVARIIQEINKDDQKLKSEWEGMSGAAVICNGLLVAVQTRHQRPTQPSYIEATPLEKVNTCEKSQHNNTYEEWQQFLKKHEINPEPEIVQLEPSSSQSAWQELFGRLGNFLKRFSSEARFSKNGKELLEKIENDRIKGQLEGPFYKQIPIQLSLERRLDLIELASPERPEQAREMLPKGNSLTSIFGNLGQAKSLLVLGEPGSGKTVALSELTQSLIQESKQKSCLSVPVFLNLSLWSDTYRNLDSWLADQLDIHYGIRNKNFIKVLIQERENIFILDGLDEVRQEFQVSCIQAINKFRLNRSQISIVVGSRLQDYEQHSSRLKFRDAVCIQALRPEEVSQYIEIEIEALKSQKQENKDDLALRGKIKQLIAIKRLIRKDTELQKVLDTPLILSVIYTTVGSQLSISSVLKYGSSKERRRKLFDAYVERVLIRRESDEDYLKKQQYKESDITHWLCWLARYMNQQNNTPNSQSEFRIEELQPNCLETNTQRLSFRFRTSIKLCFRGFECGLFSALSSALTTAILSSILLGETDLFILQTLLSCAFAGVIFGVFSGFLIGIISISFKEIGMTKSLAWSFDTIIIRIAQFTSYALIYPFSRKKEEIEQELFENPPDFERRGLGLMIVVMTLILVWKHNEIYTSHIELGDERFIKGYEALVASGATLSDGTALWLTLTIAIWFLLGLGTSGGAKETVQGQGILESQSVSSGVLLFMVTIVQPIYFYVLIEFVHAQPQFFAIESGIIAAIVTIATLWCGGITKIQHFTLRNIVSSNNLIPYDIERFLDLSAKLLLLRRFGGSYSFFHPLLQSHFLENSVDSTDADTNG